MMMMTTMILLSNFILSDEHGDFHEILGVIMCVVIKMWISWPSASQHQYCKMYFTGNSILSWALVWCLVQLSPPCRLEYQIKMDKILTYFTHLKKLKMFVHGLYDISSVRKPSSDDLIRILIFSQACKDFLITYTYSSQKQSSVFLQRFLVKQPCVLKVKDVNLK